MDKRRTRGRTKRSDETSITQSSVIKKPNSRSSPNRRTKNSSAGRMSPRSSSKASPARMRASPVRRSSRPRSAVLGASAAAQLTSRFEKAPSPVIKIEESVRKPTKSTSNKQSSSTLTTTTEVGTARSSVHSSYSVSTQKTTDIKSSINTALDSEIAKLTEYIRRSVSKTFSNRSERNASHASATSDPSRISRSISRSVYDNDIDYEDDNYSKAEFSDNEDNAKQYNSLNTTPGFNACTRLIPTCRTLPAPKEFGGFLGACTLLLVVPPLVYYLQWCCTKSACEFKSLNLWAAWNLKYIENVFDLNVIGTYFAFTSAIFILSAAIFGRRVRLPSDRPECARHFNALPIALLATIAFITAEYIKYPVADYILRNYLRYCIYGLFNALVVALWCYIIANYTMDNVQSNPYGKSGNFIIDFALGRQVNPKWLNLVEIKLGFYRVSLVSTLLLAEIYIYKNIHMPIMPTTDSAGLQLDFITNLKVFFENVRFDATSLLSSVILICYTLDAIIFEHHLASSFDLQNEGVGALLLLRYAASPFCITSVTKYVYEHKPIALSSWLCYLTLALFVIGMVIKRSSCAIKYKYRIKPTNPWCNSIETIHTFEGRRLLLGPFWGCVRQPNYAGDILALASIILPLFAKLAWPPMVCISLFIALLLHRALRVSSRNASRYHSSWVRYCSKVRHYIVPKIF